MSNFSGRVSTSSSFRVPTSRPKVFNATLPHLSVARGHCRRPSREQNAPFRSRDNLGRPFREQNAPFRSRDNLGRPSRERIAPFRSRDNLGKPSREQIAPFRSRDNLGRPYHEQNTLFHSRDNLGAVMRYGDSTGTLRGLYRNSTGAPRCRRGETRASATHRETWCLSGR